MPEHTLSAFGHGSSEHELPSATLGLNGHSVNCGTTEVSERDKNVRRITLKGIFRMGALILKGAGLLLVLALFGCVYSHVMTG